MNYDDYVIRSIIANDKLKITEVNSLESLKSIAFIKAEYSEIEKIIRTGNIEAIKAFHEDQPRTQEYLDVMMFSDQNRKPYIVTVYDSDALEQDPQVIEIYSV